MSISRRHAALLGGLSAAALFSKNANADTPFTTFSFSGTSEPGSRTMPDRIADIKNVKDFGAVGDGVTDDQPAIQNAVNWTSGANRGTIYFPPGTYNVKSPITFNYNGNLSIHFLGQMGASTVQADVTFSGGYIFDRNNVNSGSPNNTPGGRIFEKLNIIGTSATGCIRVGSSDGVAIRDCQFSNKVGITTEDAPGSSSINIIIENCTFDYGNSLGSAPAGYHGIIMGGTGIIAGCHFSGLVNAMTLYGKGIACLGNETESLSTAYLLGVDSGGTDRNLNGFAICSATIENIFTGVDFSGTCSGFLLGGINIRGENQSGGGSNYGIKVEANKASYGVFNGCVVTGYFNNVGFSIANATSRANLQLLSCSSAQSGGLGTSWSTPTNAYTAWFTQCAGVGMPVIWTFSQLPTVGGGNDLEGDEFSISDSTTTTWGANAAGTGGNHVLVRNNGSNYTVVAK